MGKLVSYGVAAYNVEKYIERCLDSIVCQPDNDIEIIIVDDGSTDSTGRLCDTYAERDSRVKVIHKKNEGVSAARNTIIDNVCGEWICLVDGDDLMDIHSTERIRQFADTECDIVYFDLIYFRFDDKISPYPNPLSIKLIENTDKMNVSVIHCTDEERKGYINKTIYNALGKVYTREFLQKNALYFNPRLIKAQDMEFNFRCLNVAKKIKLVRAGFYQYRFNPTSITKRYNPNIIEYNNRLIKAYEADIQSSGKDYLYEAFCERLKCLHIVSLKVDFNLDIFHKDNKKTREERKSDFMRLISDKRYSDAVSSCNPELLSKEDKMFLDIIKRRDFSSAEKFFKRKANVEKYKILVNRLGLVKIYKKILHKN